MRQDDGEVVVVALDELFAARQAGSPLSPASGLDLPYLAPPVQPIRPIQPEPASEPPAAPAPVVRITPAYALRPLSDALCAECGQPRHSAAGHQHPAGPSPED